MRDIKFQILWTQHKADFTTRISEHYTTVNNLCSGDDTFPYFQAEVIAKRQFTGVEDINGVEIYKGDILSSSMVNPKIGVVAYHKCGFVIKGVKNYQCVYSDLSCSHMNLKVIGNKYQNPELLEK